MISHRTIPSASDARFTLVLLHAFPLSSKMWEPAVTELQDLRDDTEIWLVDLPGFGNADLDGPWTMTEVAGELRDLLSTATGSVVLTGLSMGGYVALEFYRHFGSGLSGLILCDTKADEDSEAEKRLRSQFATDALKRGLQAAIDRLYGSFVTENTEPKTAVAIQNWMLEAKPEAIANALIAMRDRRDSLDLLPLISLPVLVVVGEKDPSMTPERMRAMAEKIANSSFQVIAGSAHLSAVDNPKEWAEVVDSFLDRIPA